MPACSCCWLLQGFEAWTLLLSFQTRQIGTHSQVCAATSAFGGGARLTLPTCRHYSGQALSQQQAIAGPDMVLMRHC